MNKNTSKIHLGLLDKNRQAVLKKLTPLLKDFVLGGGTTLALQINHRKSFDFDFFSSAPIPKNLLERLSRSLEIKNVVFDSVDELTFFTAGDIKITILYYPFKPTFKVVKFEGLQLFEVKEIALHKAYTIGRRGEYRDYFDLYTILKNKSITLNEIIKAAEKVYNGAFDEKLFLEQLVYFSDITNFEVIPASQKALPAPKKIKGFFESLVKTHLSEK